MEQEELNHDMEPPQKRSKPNNKIFEAIDDCIERMKQCSNLTAVMTEDFDKPLPTIKISVGHVSDKKFLSKAILTLNEKVPLKHLNHLKRVRGKGILLCPTDYLNGVTSIQEFIEIHTPELKNMFEYFKEVEVPAVAPKLRKQFNSQTWAMNFHPNKDLESLVSGNFFTKEDLKSHVMGMNVAFEAARWYIQNGNCSAEDIKDINATVIIDPCTFTVVAISFFNEKHPVQHSAMLAIDNVAKTQNGGAWGNNTRDKVNCTLDGIDQELLRDLQQKFSKTRFGARIFKSKRVDFMIENSDPDDYKFDTNESPYLCTGYYIYMLREPCIMCAMALVHARAKRIFYCFDNKTLGGINSRTKLQGIQSLNHHFEVFTGFL